MEGLSELLELASGVGESVLVLVIALLLARAMAEAVRGLVQRTAPAAGPAPPPPALGAGGGHAGEGMNLSPDQRALLQAEFDKVLHELREVQSRQSATFRRLDEIRTLLLQPRPPPPAE